MTKPAIVLSITLCCSLSVQSQQGTDTIPLQEVIVHAYEQTNSLLLLPAAINTIDHSRFNRQLSATPVNIFNAIPGVRMEERSPGSFRFNIRGSSLRSPFGVRNVKFYYNDIPLTEPGGTTYFNQLGIYQLQEAEIIKGPGSSLYGAGTGGVVLLNSFPETKNTRFNIDASAGSYHYYSLHGSVHTFKNNWLQHLQYQHEKTNGYRQHSGLRRDVLTWDNQFNTKKNNSFNAHLVLGDLWYETPGALTYSEYDADARAARPKVGNIPGSIESKAAIFQKSIIAGISYHQTINSHWQQHVSAYGAYLFLKNPNIRNVEKTTEPHAGARIVFQYQSKQKASAISWQNGAEIQQGFSSVKSYTNNAGNAGAPRTNNDIHTRQAFLFSQFNIQFTKWVFTAGSSLNHYHTFIKRKEVAGSGDEKNFPLRFSPRIAILRILSKNISTYASVTNGFSPPTTSELSPDGGLINESLHAESGSNVETGIRGWLLHNRLYFDISGFLFSLKNAIVQRRDAAGGNYFVNAGSTRQQGIESQLQYLFYSASKGWLHSAKLNAAYTWHHFYYKEFMQLNKDYAGNQMPGVPAQTVSSGIDLSFAKGFSFFMDSYYNSKIFLDDANSASAKQYCLLNAKLDYKLSFHNQHSLHLFFSVNNISDVQYSAGNDINGFGGRFYNAAPGRNFYTGIRLSFLNGGNE